jgi:hypothetical protein
MSDGEHTAAVAELALAQRDRIHAAARRLITAYPRLHSEHATQEQQVALRVLLCALEECGP